LAYGVFHPLLGRAVFETAIGTALPTPTAEKECDGGSTRHNSEMKKHKSGEGSNETAYE